jgi:IclR family acetate operon transcriptional repressor
MSRTVEKSLNLLVAMLSAGGRRPITDLADELAIPPATAYRLAAALHRQRMVYRTELDGYVAGPALLALTRHVDQQKLIAAVGRPVLTRLAERTGETAHLGVFEDGMVTYVCKAAVRPTTIFTREGMQLEAYCSGLGKALLAHLSSEALDQYLAEGPFVALTAETIVDPRQLRAHLDRVRDQGWAEDNGEVCENLSCLAVPVRWSDGTVAAAISVSAVSGARTIEGKPLTLRKLRDAARRIERALC